MHVQAEEGGALKNFGGRWPWLSLRIPACVCCRLCSTSAGDITCPTILASSSTHFPVECFPPRKILNSCLWICRRWNETRPSLENGRRSLVPLLLILRLQQDCNDLFVLLQHSPVILPPPVSGIAYTGWNCLFNNYWLPLEQFVIRIQKQWHQCHFSALSPWVCVLRVFTCLVCSSCVCASLFGIFTQLGFFFLLPFREEKKTSSLYLEIRKKE